LPLIVAALLLALLIVGAASAAAASSIEGIWAFGGGQVGIVPASNGTFVGIVVTEIKFAECPHPVEQEMWTDMTLQPDGSYWGHHQWYFPAPQCVENPEPGPTAWRVIEQAGGSKYLRVCFSKPGSSQPTIAPNGASTNASYGCVSSSLTAGLPTTSGSGSGSKPASGVAGEIERLSLPSAKSCLSLRRFQIHLREPKYDPFKTVAVTIKGHRVATTRHGDYVVATIDLKGLPSGAFTVKIHVTTVLGHHLSGARTYHTCAKKAEKNKPGKLR
jgi:hypothetical protein